MSKTTVKSLKNGSWKGKIMLFLSECVIQYMILNIICKNVNMLNTVNTY